MLRTVIYVKLLVVSADLHYHAIQYVFSTSYPQALFFYFVTIFRKLWNNVSEIPFLINEKKCLMTTMTYKDLKKRAKYYLPFVNQVSFQISVE